MRTFLTYAISAFVLVFLPHTAHAQSGQTDPDVFAKMQNYVGAPHFARKASFERRHVPDHWPFLYERGEISCVTVDGVAVALFQAESAEEPFMLGENMMVTTIFSFVTGNDGYLATDYDAKELIVDIGKTYNAALIRCGPPYAQ